MDAGAVAGGRGLWRSRWAAIGAAVAVTLGGGGLVAVQAASSAPSSVVTINPTVRVLDTRPESNVGLSGAFERGTSRKLRLTGSIPTTTGPQTVVPAGATGVLLNVTVQCLNRPGVVCQGGFLAVRPGDVTGPTQTSSLNFVAGDIVPNSVQVGLSAAGEIDIVYGPYVAGAQVDVLVDIVGYTVATPTDPSVLARLTALEQARPIAVASTASTGISLTPTPTTYLSVQVTAPVAGTVTINYSTYISNNTVGARSVCAPFRSTLIPPAGISFLEPGVGYWNTAAIDGTDGSVSGTSRFTIAAGETTTFVVACEEQSGNGSIGGRAMTAIFTASP